MINWRYCQGSKWYFHANMSKDRLKMPRAWAWHRTNLMWNNSMQRSGAH